MKINPLAIVAFIVSITLSPLAVAQTDQERKGNNKGGKNGGTNADESNDSNDSFDEIDEIENIDNIGNQPALEYEIWAADQSNSAPGQSSVGVRGSFLWIFDSTDVTAQLDGGPDAPPQSCSPSPGSTGPCDMLAVFPQTLMEYSQGGTPTGNQLGDLEGFGRLHGVLRDPSGRYVTANMFNPGGGFVGVIDTVTRQSVGLFRVTKFNYSDGSSNRSVHMTEWSEDGSSLLIANLHGKAIERVNISRNNDGTITNLVFDKSASLGLGKSMSVAEEATYFLGDNEWGVPLLGGIEGTYSFADLGDLTPNGMCKENGCMNGTGNTGMSGGRANNVPICPIPSQNGFLYITLGGGGLLVADHTTTPMAIVGEYGSAVVYGAGCGGVQIKNQMFLNAGISASGAGATQSMFALFSFNDNAYPSGDDILDGSVVNPQNTPMPLRVFQDEGNTLSGGNVEGNKSSDMTGQKPGITTRRDSHGAIASPNDEYLYVVDRIQNVMEVFGVDTCERHTFDLVSKTGQDGRRGPSSDCYARSVLDDPMLPLDDPAPDLLDITPDGKFIVVALRGPSPVSVKHAAQGSCPGVGIVELSADGTAGRMVGVLRTTNTIPDAVTVDDSTFPGGVPYAGKERSDVHHATIIVKQ